MRIIDLTHTITENMPVYPGTEPPRLSPASSLEKDGLRETLLRMISHTGTHMDAPAHLFPGAPTLDAMEAADFCGAAALVDCTGLAPGERITMDRLRPHMARVNTADFLLFRTGWDRFWGDERYFHGFPVMDETVAKFLARSRKKGVGVDAISVDAVAAFGLPVHRILLGAGLVIIENLTGLEALKEEAFFFHALPLKFRDADGAPVRAVAALAG